MQKPVELTNCDREPIHIPAAIQAFGCLVVVDAAEKKVVSVSSNAGDFSFSDSLPRVGDAIAETHPDLYALLGQLTDLNEGETITDVRTGSVDTESNDDFIITAHQFEGLAFLEFEPQPAHESIEGRQLLETLIRKLDRNALATPTRRSSKPFELPTASIASCFTNSTTTGMAASSPKRNATKKNRFLGCTIRLPTFQCQQDDSMRRSGFEPLLIPTPRASR